MKSAYIFSMQHDDFYHEVVSHLTLTYGIECTSSLPPFSPPDFTVVLGGDGSVLAAGRQGAPNPVLVVNTGHLGFLTSTGKENYREAIKRFVQGSYTLTKRHSLTVKVWPVRFGSVDTVLPKPQEFFAVNEVVVARNSLSKLVKVAVYVQDANDVRYQELVSEYRADGLIVSTPTGSTVYNLSAGGPIIHPDCQNIVITPICPQGLTQRPLVLPANLKVILKPVDGDSTLFLSVDGQDGCSMLGTVEVNYNQHCMETVNPISSYFMILREKLAWGVKPV